MEVTEIERILTENKELLDVMCELVRIKKESNSVYLEKGGNHGKTEKA